MDSFIYLLFLCCLCSSSQAGELSLIGKKATQSETWSDRVANLAIDGNLTSFSVAASPTNSSALGWWEVDLEGNYQIGQVILTASFEDYNAKYLQNFSIWLLDWNRNQHLCSEYRSSENLAPSETRSFPCQSDQFQARYIRIARIGGPFRPDAIALAEVNVMTGLPPSKIEAPSAEISLVGKKATQSETWSDRVANLAIDGNLTSFSVAASPTNSSALGWWEVDLEGNYQVGQVILTASFEDYNAKYLQNFSIWLLSESRTQQLCNEYTSSESLAPSETRSFPCQGDPFPTRYVRIARLGGAFRPDGLALAEVKVMSGFPSSNIVVSNENCNSTSTSLQDGYIYELPLVGKKASQSETWWDRVADLAIDGNFTSFSVAASPLNPSALGWWEVDFGGNYKIQEVRITASYEEYNAHYLQNFTIQLLSDTRSSSTCYDYTSAESIPPNQTRAFHCLDGTFPARYLRISRLGGPFRQDALSLAEVQVFVYSGQSVPSRIYAPDVGGYEVYLKGFKTYQSNTWGDHFSYLAIDNDPSTFTISCVTCNNTLVKGVGWWHIDLGTDRPIAAVALTSSLDQYNSNYLQDIIISLTSWNTTDLTVARICYFFSNNSMVPAGTTLIFKCTIQPTWGRFLMVRRMENAAFRPDALAIAEIKVYEQTPTNVPQPVTGDSNATENGTVPKSSIVAIQSATFNNFPAGLAVDNNVYTFASAIASSLVPYWSPVAWWQADLGKFYNVSQVDITSPQDDQYARHLVSFSIDVYPNSVLEDAYLTGSIQCAYYPVGNYIAPGKTEKFVCIAPNYGRYLIVRKVKNVDSTPEYLSFAEITIHYK